jgi:acylglycerol lipase
MPDLHSTCMNCRQGFVDAADGVLLSYTEWQPPEVHSAAVFIHGIGLDSSSAPYGDRILIPKLPDTLFCSIDLRGHGKSGGSIDDLSQYTLLEDIDRHLARIKSAYGNVPVFLYGHNFGGMLSLYHASERPGDIAGVIVSEYSTLISLNVKKIMEPGTLASLKDMILKRIRPNSRRFEFLTAEEYGRICNMYNIPVDGSILNSLASSCASGNCTSYGKEFFRACGVGREKQIAKNVDVPVLMIFSRNDAFFDARGAYDILTRLKTYDKELVLVDCPGHYGSIDTGRDTIGKWISKRIARD